MADNCWVTNDTIGMNDLDLLVYQSRLVGSDPALVVWGGGNTSIKTEQKDHLGRATKVMLIKGSGSDMKTIQHQHFPALRLEEILPLFDESFMSDEDMVSYLSKCMLDPSAPRPSIETLLHAFLPMKSVLHSHADAIVSLTNNSDAASILDKVYSGSVAAVEYIRPGFLLSKKVGQAFADNPALSGVILVNHGLFTWGDTPKEAYDKHIDLVNQSEEYVRHVLGSKRIFAAVPTDSNTAHERRNLAASVAPIIRGAVGLNNQVILRYDDSSDILNFLASSTGERLSQIGPATPDHLIQTKRYPLWIRLPESKDPTDIGQVILNKTREYSDIYSEWYRKFTDNSYPMLDPYPRVILIPGLGMWTTGKDSKSALIAGDIYHHTISVIAMSESVSQYTSLAANDAFEAEYWPMELYKLTLAPPEKELARKVALVTGGAHGIGLEIAQLLASEGAHVVITDIDEEGAQSAAQNINDLYGLKRGIGVKMDVTDESQVVDAFRSARLAFGGLDILVSNAGIATPGTLDQLSLSDWQRSLDINTTGHFLVSKQAITLMKQQSHGGSIVFIGTKNVPAPGKDFGAYSASKAAECQLARILAIENGEHGIRSNIVNPDAIFKGSSLWSEEVRQQRAGAHNIPVDELENFYKERNLLREHITAYDVAQVVLFLASDRSLKTTGAMIPVDGGLREAFPR